MSNKFPKPTPKMIEFFRQRTADHINRVMRYMSQLRGTEGLDDRELMERARQHDRDKYTDQNLILPYIWLTEYHRVNNETGSVDAKLEQLKEQTKDATAQHIQNNRHHPEAHEDPTAMQKLDLAEMVSDWAAMADELGEGSPRGWAEKNIGSKWEFSPEQEKFIYRLIDKLENKMIKTASTPIKLDYDDLMLHADFDIEDLTSLDEEIGEADVLTHMSTNIDGVEIKIMVRGRWDLDHNHEPTFSIDSSKPVVVVWYERDGAEVQHPLDADIARDVWTERVLLADDGIEAELNRLTRDYVSLEQLKRELRDDLALQEWKDRRYEATRKSAGYLGRERYTTWEEGAAIDRAREKLKKASELKALRRLAGEAFKAGDKEAALALGKIAEAIGGDRPGSEIRDLLTKLQTHKRWFPVFLDQYKIATKTAVKYKDEAKHQLAVDMVKYFWAQLAKILKLPRARVSDKWPRLVSVGATGDQLIPNEADKIDQIVTSIIAVPGSGWKLENSSSMLGDSERSWTASHYLTIGVKDFTVEINYSVTHKDDGVHRYVWVGLYEATNRKQKRPARCLGKTMNRKAASNIIVIQIEPTTKTDQIIDQVETAMIDVANGAAEGFRLGRYNVLFNGSDWDVVDYQTGNHIMNYPDRGPVEIRMVDDWMADLWGRKNKQSNKTAQMITAKNAPAASMVYLVDMIGINTRELQKAVERIADPMPANYWFEEPDRYEVWFDEEDDAIKFLTAVENIGIRVYPERKGNTMNQRHASYWQLPEDMLYGIMGIEPSFEYFDEYAMPEGLPTDEASRRIFYEALEEQLGRLNRNVEEVLDQTRQTAKLGIDLYLKDHGADPADAQHELWYHNMADDFAHEELFGLLGGDPEYNEIHLTYMPEMFRWLGIEEDPEFFDQTVEAVGETGNEAWANWVKPTIQNAWDEAKEAVLESVENNERIIEFIRQLDRDEPDLNDEQLAGIVADEFDLEDETAISMVDRAVNQPDPRQQQIPLGAGTRKDLNQMNPRDKVHLYGRLLRRAQAELREVRAVNSYPELPDGFTRAYVEAAMWSSPCDEEDDCENLDDKYDIEDISDECIDAMIEDCRKFQEQFADLLARADYKETRWSNEELAGHDFWLTRNGHGAGFWDRGLGDVGDQLTEAADSFGETWLYVGDDGKIYCN